MICPRLREPRPEGETQLIYTQKGIMEHSCALLLNSNIDSLNNSILIKRNFVGVSDLESLGPYVKTQWRGYHERLLGKL